MTSAPTVWQFLYTVCYPSFQLNGFSDCTYCGNFYQSTLLPPKECFNIEIIFCAFLNVQSNVQSNPIYLKIGEPESPTQALSILKGFCEQEISLVKFFAKILFLLVINNPGLLYLSSASSLNCFSHSAEDRT